MAYVQSPSPSQAMIAGHPQMAGPKSPEGPMVHVIDDDASIRETVNAMLGERGFRYQAFASAEEYLSTNLAATPDCLVLDHKLPGINGLELLQRLVAANRAVPIVVVSGNIDVPQTVQFLQRGATTLLPKPFKSDELQLAVNQAIESGKVKTKVRDRFAEIGSAVEQLTARETTVLQAIVAGQLNKAIARQLDVSVRTVEGDRAKIVEKFEAETTGEVVAKYAQFSLLAELGGPAGLEKSC